MNRIEQLEKRIAVIKKKPKKKNGKTEEDLILKICKWCDGDMFVTMSQMNKKFCSSTCQYRNKLYQNNS